MCGIAGCFKPKWAAHRESSRIVERMIHTLIHRGPDSGGLWSSENGEICLGHRRLSIIDLSPSGAQPMHGQDRAQVITYNGEIYNYLELCKELQQQNISFRGHSDTEVLLAAIDRWGFVKALEKLVGMFAIALWDSRSRKLFLARDRAGKKPLYYYNDGKSFYFSSEIKAFKGHDELKLTIDEEAVSHYLSLGYIPCPLTIYKEIREVPPGHYMIVNSSLDLNSGVYWRYHSGECLKRSISFQDIVEKTDSLLSDAIRLRLRADVPVGIFLSGGIDSGLITAIASKVSGQQIKTFTVGFDSETFDESFPARLVAKKYATDHSEIRLPSRLDDLLPEIVNAYDEPFADPSAVPTFAVAKAASSHIKVILNGEGADELFGGYRRHQAMKYLVNIANLIKFIPEKFWRIMVDSLPVPRKSRTIYAFFHRFSRGVPESPFERYLVWGSDGFTEKEKSLFLGEDTTAQHYTAKYLEIYFSWLETSDPVKHFMALDFLSMMVDSLLVKMDIATMAHGLEARCPFLDHRLVETVSCLPVRTLMSGHQSKPVLRELAKRYLPVELVTAPKRGFEIPLIQWMNDYLFSMTRDLCKSSNGIISQLFDQKALDRLFEKPAWMDEERWAKRMWIIMMLALWDYQK